MKINKPDDKREQGSPVLKSLPLIDASVQAEAQDWVDMECQQIDAGAFQGHITRFTLGPMEICHEEQNRCVHKYGQLPPGRCTLSAAYRSRGSGWFADYGLDRHAPLFFLPAGSEFDVYAPGGLSTLYLAFDEHALLSGLHALDPAKWKAMPRQLSPLGTGGRDLFLYTLQQVMALSRQVRDVEWRNLQCVLIHNILTAINHEGSGAPCPRPGPLARQRKLHVVRQAREAMAAQLERHCCPTIADICAALDVSERTLQYSFRDLLQVTPVAYLRILRLNKVRMSLLTSSSPTTTVTRAATRYGFLHLGKFARDYFRQFGEKPSQTLSRSLALP